MKSFKPLSAVLILWPLLLATLSFLPVSAAVADLTPDNATHDEKTNWISAADPRFRYEGRFDFSDSKAQVDIWQASRISLDFSGDSVGLRFGDAKGQSYFNVAVDGSNTVVEVLEGKPANPAIVSSRPMGKPPDA